MVDTYIQGVYKITNLINQKIYIGISKNCWKRWSDHRAKAIHSPKKEDKNKALYRAMRKYGVENFSFEIIEELPDATIEELKEAEIKWISYYDSYKKGYNETKGGDYLSKNSIHYGEDHVGHIFSLEDVKDCRRRYANGEKRLEVYKIYLEKYPNLKESAFANMYFGRNWKWVMPEVFEVRQHPRQKVTKEQVIDVRNKYEKDGWKITQIAKHYKGILGYGTIWDIVHYKRYPDIKE